MLDDISVFNCMRQTVLTFMMNSDVTRPYILNGINNLRGLLAVQVIFTVGRFKSVQFASNMCKCIKQI